MGVAGSATSTHIMPTPTPQQVLSMRAPDQDGRLLAEGPGHSDASSASPPAAPPLPASGVLDHSFGESSLVWRTDGSDPTAVIFVQDLTIASSAQEAPKSPSAALPKQDAVSADGGANPVIFVPSPRPDQALLMPPSDGAIAKTGCVGNDAVTLTAVHATANETNRPFETRSPVGCIAVSYSNTAEVVDQSRADADDPAFVAIRSWCKEQGFPDSFADRLVEEDVEGPADLVELSDSDLEKICKGLKLGPKGRFKNAVWLLRKPWGGQP